MVASTLTGVEDHRGFRLSEPQGRVYRRLLVCSAPFRARSASKGVERRAAKTQCSRSHTHTNTLFAFLRHPDTQYNVRSRDTGKQRASRADGTPRGNREHVAAGNGEL